MKNTGTLAIAATVLILGPAAQAAGPLLPGLQARLSATNTGLAALPLSATPALQPALAATTLAGLSPGAGVAAEPLPALDRAWLNYNLYEYPAVNKSWRQTATAVTLSATNEFAVGLATLPTGNYGGPGSGCPDNACNSAGDRVNGYASSKVIGGGTKMAGFTAGIPRPPLPKFPDELSPALEAAEPTLDLVFDAVFAPQGAP